MKPSTRTPGTTEPGNTEIAKGTTLGLDVSGLAPSLADDAVVYVQGARTVLELRVNRPIAAHVTVLSQPDRILVDVADLDFALPAGAGQSGAGLIAAFRFGLVAEGRSRVVLDATRSVNIVRAGMMAKSAGQPHRFEIVIEAAPAAWAPATIPADSGASSRSFAGEKKRSDKFVVMIDPGHGGIDGGAVGANHIVEKDLTLAIAKQLKTLLDARGRYDARLTRSSDVFVSLDARVEKSIAAGADLFISLHADATADVAAARTAQGATVYTLSETASHVAAARFAEKENAADAKSGVIQATDSDAHQVNSILADLMKRETHNFSLQFKSMVLDRLRPAQMLARDPSRAAAFKVLRQMQTPTVLIELGYLTNEADVAQMQSVDWQKRMVQALATAVDAYAERRQ